MLNKTLSLLLILGLITTANLSILAQTQSPKLKNSQQLKTLSKKEFLDKLGINPADRATELLDKDFLTKVKRDSLTDKALQDADKTQQKKKFSGINTTTAIIIGGVLAVAIIVVLAAKGGNDKPRGQVYCADIRSPCP